MTDDVKYWFVNYVVIHNDQVLKEKSTIITNINEDFFPLRKITNYFSGQLESQKTVVIRNWKRASKEMFNEFWNE